MTLVVSALAGETRRANAKEGNKSFTSRLRVASGTLFQVLTHD